MLFFLSLPGDMPDSVPAHRVTECEVLQLLAYNREIFECGVSHLTSPSAISAAITNAKEMTELATTAAASASAAAGAEVTSAAEEVAVSSAAASRAATQAAERLSSLSYLGLMRS
jgi:hypothetical protein